MTSPANDSGGASDNGIYSSRSGMAGLVLLALLVVPAIAQESSSPSPSRAGGSATPSGQGIDPSENVKALSEAASKRQDDLRIASEKMVQVRIDALEKYAELLAEHNKDLREAAVLRLDSEARLRADHNERLAVAEAKRIDAIRAVDVNAVAVASTRATDQASVLATQVSQSAEALRALVATTAATVAASQQQLANTLSARLTTLEQAGYQQTGKQLVQDPAFLALIARVENLTQSKTAIAGIGEGQGMVIGWAVTGLLLLAAVGGLVISIMRNGRSKAA